MPAIPNGRVIWKYDSDGAVSAPGFVDGPTFRIEYRGQPKMIEVGWAIAGHITVAEGTNPVVAIRIETSADGEHWATLPGGATAEGNGTSTFFSHDISLSQFVRLRLAASGDVLPEVTAEVLLFSTEAIRFRAV